MEKTSVTTVTHKAREKGRCRLQENKLSRLDKSNRFNKPGCEKGGADCVFSSSGALLVG